MEKNRNRFLRYIKIFLKNYGFYTTYAKKEKDKKCVPSHFRNTEAPASIPGI